MDDRNNGWSQPGGRSPVIRRHGSISDMKRQRMQTVDAQAQPMPDPAIPSPGYEANAAQPGRTPQTHTQTVGARGPGLAVDTALHETMGSFANATSLLRVVHTKGFGAFGYFRSTHSMKPYTKARFLQGDNKQVPVAVRFSFAASNPGTPDTLRNVRGFSTRFYTQDGNFDLLCNHIPVFFVRDAIRLPDVLARLGPSPINNIPDPERFWSAFADYPETTNMLTWFFSDAGTVKSFRHMPGHSVSTYVWRNEEGVRHYVKYHWLPAAGEETIDRREAELLTMENPDYSGQDLYDTIAGGATVAYDLYVQLMNPEDERGLPYDPLDDTKIWDETMYPLMPVGHLVLNRNPDDFAQQVEKLALAPANLVPGLELSDDKMLQGRSMVYFDAQRHRLGPDFRNIPVNKQANWSPATMVSSGMGESVFGEIVRSDIPKADDFSQAGEHYNSLPAVQQEHLADNIAVSLVDASNQTQRTVLEHLAKASQELAQKVVRQMAVYDKA